MNWNVLNPVLLENVVDLTFIEKGDRSLRRMICTKSSLLLKSLKGKMILKYREPRGGERYNLSKFNNLIVFDIANKDFRTVSCDTAKVIEVIPIKEFWEYYENTLQPNINNFF